MPGSSLTLKSRFGTVAASVEKFNGLRRQSLEPRPRLRGRARPRRACAERGRSRRRRLCRSSSPQELLRRALARPSRPAVSRMAVSEETTQTRSLAAVLGGEPLDQRDRRARRSEPRAGRPSASSPTPSKTTTPRAPRSATQPARRSTSSVRSSIVAGMQRGCSRRTGRASDQASAARALTRGLEERRCPRRR